MDSWQVMSYNAPILPIHAGLLRTGKVFFFAGSGNNPDNWAETKGSAVWNTSNGNFDRPVTPVDGGGIPFDIFCAGQTFLADGSLLVVGGTLQYDPFDGTEVALKFNPSTGTWTQTSSMAHGRWYPTALTLGNGNIFAISGLDENGNLNVRPEVYKTSPEGWTAYPQTTSYFPLYPHLFLLSSGKIFYSGGYMGGSNGVTPRILTLPASFNQTITEQSVSGLQSSDYGNQAASVLLPPAQNQKVMIIGGGNGSDNAINRVNIVDLTATTPTYTAAASLNYARMHCSAVLLPDRTVFVCGGSNHAEDGSTGHAANKAEIYNPATNTWTVAAQASVKRLYHSVALLLPDGRVATAGGNPYRTGDELRLEIYSPAYMSQTRPVITNAPSDVTYGQQFTIQVSQTPDIKWVSLIRPAAPTHSCDTEQRLVDLPINSFSNNTLTVTLTTNSNIATPGYYMLFVTNQSGVPSVASWIKVA